MNKSLVHIPRFPRGVRLCACSLSRCRQWWGTASLQSCSSAAREQWGVRASVTSIPDKGSISGKNYTSKTGSGAPGSSYSNCGCELATPDRVYWNHGIRWSGHRKLSACIFIRFSVTHAQGLTRLPGSLSTEVDGYRFGCDHLPFTNVSLPDIQTQYTLSATVSRISCYFTPSQSLELSDFQIFTNLMISVKTDPI